MIGWLRNLASALFGSGGGESDPGQWHYVQCQTCGEIVPVRVDPLHDLVQEFESAGDAVSGYSLHKEVMGRGGMPGKPCFRLLRLDGEFDERRRLLFLNVSGGDLVDAAAYEAQQASIGAGQPPGRPGSE